MTRATLAAIVVGVAVVAGQDAHAEVKNLTGQVAPDLGTFEQASGTDKIASLAALKGKVVLLEFFATTCDQCNREAKELDKLYKEYKDKGFVLLAVSDEPVDKIREFVQKHG